MFGAVSMFGEVQVPTERQALAIAKRRATVYRARVQAAIVDGKGLDEAHEAAGHLLREAYAALKAAGMEERDAWEVIAQEFHG